MIVVDASVVGHWLLASRRSKVPASLVDGAELAAPHLIDAEVGHTIRRHLLTGLISLERATIALEDFMTLPIERYAHTTLLPRAFALRHNATIHDALYLALAEALGARLLTRDAALTAVPGLHISIELIANGT